MMSPTGKVKIKTGARGLALVEVLVAIMILSTSTVLILQALSRTAVLEREILNLGRAQAFASNKMAELEALSLKGAEFKDKQNGNFTEQKQAFHWQMTALPYDEDPVFKRIILDVSWKQGAENYQRRVESLVQFPEPAESAQ